MKWFSDCIKFSDELFKELEVKGVYIENYPGTNVETIRYTCQRNAIDLKFDDKTGELFAVYPPSYNLEIDKNLTVEDNMTKILVLWLDKFYKVL